MSLMTSLVLFFSSASHGEFRESVLTRYLWVSVTVTGCGTPESLWSSPCLHRTPTPGAVSLHTAVTVTVSYPHPQSPQSKGGWGWGYEGGGAPCQIVPGHCTHSSRAPATRAAPLPHHALLGGGGGEATSRRTSVLPYVNICCCRK